MKRLIQIFFLMQLAFAQLMAKADTLEVINLNSAFNRLSYFQISSAKVLTSLNPFDFCYVDAILFLPNSFLSDTASLNKSIRFRLNEELLEPKLKNQIDWHAKSFWKDKERLQQDEEGSKYDEDDAPLKSVCIRSVHFEPLYLVNQYLTYLCNYEYEIIVDGEAIVNSYYRVFYFDLETGKEVNANSIFEPIDKNVFANYLSKLAQQKLESNKGAFLDLFDNANLSESEGEEDVEEIENNSSEKQFNDWKEKVKILPADLNELVYMPTPAGLSILILPYAFGRVESVWLGFQFILAPKDVQRFFKPSPLIEFCQRSLKPCCNNINLFKQRGAVFDGPEFPLMVNPWQQADGRLCSTKKIIYRQDVADSNSLGSPIYVVTYNDWGAPKQVLCLDGLDTLANEMYYYNSSHLLTAINENQDNNRHTRNLQLRYDVNGNLTYVLEANDVNSDQANIERIHYLVDENLVYEYDEIDFFESMESISQQFKVHEINALGMLLRTRMLNKSFEWENRYNLQNQLIATYDYSGRKSDFRIYGYDLNQQLVSIESGTEDYSLIINRDSSGNPIDISVNSYNSPQSKVVYQYNSSGLIVEMRGLNSSIYTFRYIRE